MVQVEYHNCRCHRYDFATGKRISESTDNDISYCDKYISISPDDWAAVDNLLNKMRASKHK